MSADLRGSHSARSSGGRYRVVSSWIAREPTSRWPTAR